MLRYLLVARFHTPQEAQSAADDMLRLMMGVWHIEHSLAPVHITQYSTYLHPRRRPIEERLHSEYQAPMPWPSLHWYTLAKDVFRLTHVVDRWVFINTEYSVFQPFQQLLEQCKPAWMIRTDYQDAQPPGLWLSASASAKSDEHGYAACEQFKRAFDREVQGIPMDLAQLALPERAGDYSPAAHYYPSLRELQVRGLFQYRPWIGLQYLLSFLRYSGFQRIQIGLSPDSAEVL